MAQVITIDAGKHNADLRASSARLSSSGSWKKQRVVQIIPGGSSIPAKAYVSHRGMITPPNQAFIPLYVEGAEVGAAYDEAIQLVLNNKDLRDFEFVLFVEHDNLPQPTGLIKLIEHLENHPELSAVSGLYWTKGEGGCAQIWGDINDPVENYRPQVPDLKGGLIETYGIGQGFALWRMSTFHKLRKAEVPRPWFETVKDERGMGTQDLYFSKLARAKAGAKMAVACDVLVGHLDINTNFVW